MTPELDRRISNASKIDSRLASRLCLRAQKGDDRARDQLIEAYLGLVAHACHKYGRGEYYEFDDLFSIGVEGLIKAIDRYDPTRSCEFKPYLWVKFAIIDANQSVRKRSAHEQALPVGFDELVGVYDQPEEPDYRAVLLEAFSVLTEKQRETIMLHYMGDERRTFKEVARLRSVKHWENIWQQEQDAFKKLKKVTELKELFEDIKQRDSMGAS